MEFTLKGQDLLEGFQMAAAVVGPRTTREVTRNIKLTCTQDEVRVFAVGDECAINYRVTPEEVVSPGEVVLPAETMVGVLRESRGEAVSIRLQELACEVEFQQSFFRVLGEDPSGFPEVMQFDEAGAVEVPAAVLRQMIPQTLFAASTEDTRYAMNGVLFAPAKGSLELVATDGRRLAYAKQRIAGLGKAEPVIVPRLALGQIVKMLPSGDEARVKLAIAETQVALETERGAIFAKLIDGSFPPYQDVIPKECTFKVEFDVQQLASAVRRAALLTDPTSKTVCFTLREGELGLSSRAADRGEARITVSVACERTEPFVTYFNPDYVADCLKVIECEQVTMEFTTENRQAAMKAEGGLIYVVMPVTPGEV